MKLPKTLFLALFYLFVVNEAFAQPGIFHDSRDKVTVSVHISPKNAVAGSDAIIAIVLDHEAHWHSHTNDPQVPEALGDPEDYIATAVEFDLPDDSSLTLH
ncbi:MAG: hypothetical protein ACKVIO_02265, partial [Phycisphaerales bacterium]